MRKKSVELSEDLIDSIKKIVEKTGAYNDEEDFIQEAILKQLRRYKDI